MREQWQHEKRCKDDCHKSTCFKKVLQFRDSVGIVNTYPDGSYYLHDLVFNHLFQDESYYLPYFSYIVHLKSMSKILIFFFIISQRRGKIGIQFIDKKQQNTFNTFAHVCLAKRKIDLLAKFNYLIDNHPAFLMSEPPELIQHIPCRSISHKTIKMTMEEWSLANQTEKPQIDILRSFYPSTPMSNMHWYSNWVFDFETCSQSTNPSEDHFIYAIALQPTHGVYFLSRTSLFHAKTIEHKNENRICHGCGCALAVWIKRCMEEFKTKNI